MMPIIILIFLLFKILIVTSQQIVTQQKDLYAKRNTNVIFECRINGYDSSQDVIEWCKNDFCTWGRLFEMTSQQRLQYKSLPKYFIVGNRTLGEWNLLIENVTESEIGDYKCSLTRRSTRLKIESKSIRLSLMKKPKAILLDTERPIDIELDESKTFTCKVNDGVPKSTVVWKLRDLKNEILLNNSISSYDDDVTISKLVLKGSLDLRNKQLVCSVEHPLLEKPFVSLVDINLKFAPVLMFELNEELVENKTHKFECTSLASPESLKPSIISLIDHKGNIITQSMSGSIQLKLTRDMNGKILSCFNENSIGNSVIKHMLNISYPPQFKESPKAIITIANPKEVVRLKCTVDSNPPARISWNKNSKEILGYGETYDIKHVPFDPYSRIYAQINCAAISSPKFNEIQSKSLVITSGLPSISGENIYYAENQKDLVAKFNILASPEILATPKCTKLTINKNDNLKQTFLPIENYGRYELVQDVVEENIMANLSKNFLFKINGVSNFDVGIFNCSVANSYGISSFIFEVQMKNDNSKFIIALSTSILFLLLLFCLIVLIIVFVLRIKLKNKKLKNQEKHPAVNGFSNTSYVKNSPNLSVSEWVTNTPDKFDEKLSQCDITFDGKLSSATNNIVNQMKSRSKSSFNSDNQIIMDKKNFNYDCLIVPLDPSNYMIGTHSSSDDSKLYIDPATASYNFNYYPINTCKQTANILSSKLQTNV